MSTQRGNFSQPPAQIKTVPKREKSFWSVPGCLLGIFLIALSCVILFPVFASSRPASKQAQSINNMKHVSTGFILYLSDNDDRFPNAESWQDDIYPYVKNPDIFSSPLLSSGGLKTAIAMNSALSFVSESKVESNSKMVLTFLFTQTRKSPHGGKESLAVLQNETVMIGYVDTSVKYLKTNTMMDLVWLPGPEKGAK